MSRLLIALCCVALLVPTLASAEIYKWKDKSGKTQYSDSPPLTNTPCTTLSGKKIPVAAPAPPAAAATDNQKQPVDPAKSAAAAAPSTPKGKGEEPNPSKDKVEQGLKDKAAQDAKNAADTKKQQEEKQAAEKKAKDQACKEVRFRLAQFSQGGRIYKVNEQGERDYYGDKEIAAELENAKNDVAANCE